ncbi:MAG: T9SS type A sorting domain-containing protein [Bacteroidetes bacterium]|nr:T9SS type A sorting domain-containing protein [Bacteroidota bacterium]
MHSICQRYRVFSKTWGYFIAAAVCFLTQSIYSQPAIIREIDRIQGTLCFDASGNALVARNPSGNVEVCKYNSNLDLVWTHTYDTTVDLALVNLRTDAYGNAYVVCNAVFSTVDALSYRLSKDGDYQWTHVYNRDGLRSKEGAKNNLVDWFSGDTYVFGEQDIDGNCFSYIDEDWIWEFFLCKIDSTGSEVYRTSYSGPTAECKYTYDRITYDLDGNAYPTGAIYYPNCLDDTCGYIEGCTPDIDLRIFKYNQAGAIAWYVDVPEGYGNWSHTIGNYGGFKGNLINHVKSVPDLVSSLRCHYPGGGLRWQLTPGGAVVAYWVMSNGLFRVIREVEELGSTHYYCTDYDTLAVVQRDFGLLGPHVTRTLDQNQNMFVLYTDRIECYDIDGELKWTTDCSNYNIIRVDSLGYIYVANSAKIAKLGIKEFVLLDGSLDSNRVAEEDFELYSIDSSVAGFIVRQAGSFETDLEGVLEFGLGEDYELIAPGGVGTGLNVGELALITKRVDSKEAEKHQSILGTIYNVWVDPIKFDEYGHIDLTEINDNSMQQVVLDHTELRYNLLVSIEWDASTYYHEGLRANFRAMSNYLYDVFDGQVRLDTVVIVDNMQHWDDADIVIHSDNFLRPYCVFRDMLVPGIERPWYYYAQIHMPRIWFGSESLGRDVSYGTYPHQLAKSTMYRAMAHELGHYAFMFEDEYKFWNAPTNTWVENVLRCAVIDNYGFMDRTYWLANPQSTEMSVDLWYLAEECQNNQQWINREKSCWTMFDDWAEDRAYGLLPRPVFYKPDTDDPEERKPPPNLATIPGPNQDGYELGDPKDYDVGALVIFPGTLLPQEAGTRDISVRTYFSGSPQGEMRVTLKKQIPGTSIAYGRSLQGRSTKFTVNSNFKEGYIWVLGARPDDIIDVFMGAYREETPPSMSLALKEPEKIWLVGQAVVGQSGVSRYGTAYSLSAEGDSLEIEVRQVEGHYPLVPGVDLSGDTVTVRFTFEQAFNETPSLELRTASGEVYSYPLTHGATAYTAAIGDTLGRHGSFTVGAVDSVGLPFFLDLEYEVAQSEAISGSIYGPTGDCQLSLESPDAFGLIMVLSSEYPTIRGNLTSGALQAGKTHCLVSDGDLTSSGLTIYYSDDDLAYGDMSMGDETTLQINLWDPDEHEWQPLTSAVDIQYNSVTAAIPSGGTYAAFTTNIITDVEEDEYGETLPYRFELSQNYPNPFNPVTTIEYNLPRRSSIRIDVFNLLGQKVRTLVDREESAGSYTITWDGTSTSGQSVSTGVYFYRFQADDHVETKKMLLLK